MGRHSSKGVICQILMQFYEAEKLPVGLAKTLAAHGDALHVDDFGPHLQLTRRITVRPDPTSNRRAASPTTAVEVVRDGWG